MSSTGVDDETPPTINQRYASDCVIDDPILDIFDTGDFSDCTIICRNRVWRLHKAILGSRCEFFAEIFTETPQEPISGVVVLDDTDPGILDIVLQHCYVRIPYNIGRHIERCKMPEDIREVIDLICAADRFGVLDLVKQAVGILEDMIKDVEWSEDDAEEIARMTVKAGFAENACRAFTPVKPAIANFIARIFQEHESLRGPVNDMLGQYAVLRMLVMSESLLTPQSSISAPSTSTLVTASSRPKVYRSGTSKNSNSSTSSWSRKFHWP